MTSNQKPKEKKMKVSQPYRTALIAIHTIDSASQKRKSALRGLMQRLCLTFLACTLVISATGTASAGGLPLAKYELDAAIAQLCSSQSAALNIRIAPDSRTP
jgi:hypothetical protein